jgi:hypothetical protein
MRLPCCLCVSLIFFDFYAVGVVEGKLGDSFSLEFLV